MLLDLFIKSNCRDRGSRVIGLSFGNLDADDWHDTANFKTIWLFE